jgi:hypothetical protein
MKDQHSNTQVPALPEEIQQQQGRSSQTRQVQRHFTRSFQRMNPQMNVNLNQVWGFYNNQAEF